MKQVFFLDQDEDKKEDCKDTEESNINFAENEIPMGELNNRQEREECFIFDQNGQIIGEIESVRLRGPQRAKRKKLIQIMIYS